MEEIILVVSHENHRISKIANFLKKKFIIKKVWPRNIVIYASSNKKTIKTSLIMRDVIKNRIIYYPVCILQKSRELFESTNSTNKVAIIVANPKQISGIIQTLKNTNKTNLDFISIK